MTLASKPSPIRRGVWAALIALCLANLAAHLFAQQFLPDTVPMHWGVSGAADGWAPKPEIIILAALPAALLALFWFVPRIDPKGQAYERMGGVWPAFVVGFTLFMCVMTWMPEATVFGWIPAAGVGSVGTVVCCLIGVLFIGLGNYLPRVKQNYTFGVKTPWALDDPDNWRRTQRFGGVCFVAMGLVLVALGFLGPALTREAAVAVLLAVVLLPCVAMYVYSYLLWRRCAAR